MKEQLLMYITKLLTEVQNPKTLLLRTATMLVLILGWTLIDNPDAVLKVAKEFTRESFIVSMEEEHKLMVPIVSRERVSLIYGQVNPDLVYVVTYQPKQQNDYLTIVAVEGSVGRNILYENSKLVIRKNSKMYLTHLSSRNYISVRRETNYVNLLYQANIISDLGIEYLYTCPIYSLDNIYSGHIGIAFVHEPEPDKAAMLESVCVPNARAVGRYL